MIALLFVAASLSACSDVTRPPPAATVVEFAGGGISPESVTQSFFEDFTSALSDPGLNAPDRRNYWVVRLAAYFTMEERRDQEKSIDSALTHFVEGRTGLADNETLTLELRYDRPQKVADDGTRALVKLPNATIAMTIVQATSSGPVTVYEQPIGLDKVTGRSDSTVPLVKVNGRWYLTEGS